MKILTDEMKSIEFTYTYIFIIPMKTPLVSTFPNFNSEPLKKKKKTF